MTYYLRRALLAVVLLAALLLAGLRIRARTERTAPRPPVCCRVGTEGTYAPFSFQDPATGQLAGYDVDVANAVGRKLGKKVEFVQTPWDSIFAALEANRFDVVANEVTITPERQAKYDLSEPYSVGEGVIITRANDDSIKSLNDLKGKTVGATITSNWAQVSRDAGATLEPVEGFTQAITLLNQGRVDAVVNDSIAFHAYQAETNDQSVKIGATIGREERAGLRGPQEQRPAARTEQGPRRTEGRRHAGEDLAEVPQGQRHRAPSPTGQAAVDVEAHRETTCGRWPRRRSRSPSR